MPVTPIIILVEPQMGENIGAAARAMANFAVREMRIVSPRDGWPNPKAIDMAKHAAPILEQALVCDSLSEATADIQQLYAATARRRDMAKPTITARECATSLLDTTATSAIMFGPERSGLSNEHIAMADSIVTIPVSPDYPSLNIAQSVNVIAYEWFTTVSHSELTDEPISSSLATKEELNQFFDHLESQLEAKGFFQVAEKQPKMMHNIKTMFTRANLTDQEVRSLHGMIRSLGRG